MNTSCYLQFHFHIYYPKVKNLINTLIYIRSVLVNIINAPVYLGKNSTNAPRVRTFMEESEFSIYNISNLVSQFNCKNISFNISLLFTQGACCNWQRKSMKRCQQPYNLYNMQIIFRILQNYPIGGMNYP